MQAQSGRPDWFANVRPKLADELTSKYGTPQRAQIERGIDQVADFWRARGRRRRGIRGVHAHELRRGAGDARLDVRPLRAPPREARRSHERDRPRLPRAGGSRPWPDPAVRRDRSPATDPSAHVTDDFFQNKLAFVVLLNFPLTTLEQRLDGGGEVDAPAVGGDAPRTALLEAGPGRGQPGDRPRARPRPDQYISGYNIWMHHLVDDKGNRLFPPELRLLSHWNLRDEIKASYDDLEERPRQAAHDPEGHGADRRPRRSPGSSSTTRTSIGTRRPTTVVAAAARDTDQPAPADLEGDERSRARHALRHAPRRRSTPSARSIPTRRPRRRCIAIGGSTRTARSRRRGSRRCSRRCSRRRSCPGWHAHRSAPRAGRSSRSTSGTTASAHAAATPRRSSTPSSQEALPDAAGLREGHAEPARRARVLAGASAGSRGQHRRRPGAWLGTRLGRSDALGKGASAHPRRCRRHGLQGLQHRRPRDGAQRRADLLAERASTTRCSPGCPNTAFTEALAFVFQAHDLELLGLAQPPTRRRGAEDARRLLGRPSRSPPCRWSTWRSGTGCTITRRPRPAELKEATLQIAKDVWNRYYAPVFGQKDVVLLGIYSHMISYPIYLPDYPIGHLIAFQIEAADEEGRRHRAGVRAHGDHTAASRPTSG